MAAMKDYWPPADPYADIEADATRCSRAARNRALAEKRAAEKLANWMQAIEDRIAKLEAQGATSIYLEPGDGDSLPSITYSFAPRPKEAAQRIFDDARPRLSSGLV